MKIAAGIITWQDGPVLERAIASVRDACDVVILADGAIAGVDRQGLPTVTPGLRELPVDKVIGDSGGVWSSQSAKRTALLDEARAFGCDWLLQIDADERLKNAHLLRRWLVHYPGDTFPIPFQFTANADPVSLGAWKLLKVHRWMRIVSQGGYVEHVDGNVYAVWSQTGQRAPVGFERMLPWISHHPDERPPGRAAIRLGEWEGILEQRPPETMEIDLPGFAPPPISANAHRVLQVAEGNQTGGTMTEPNSEMYFCAQCGARYAGPGLCENGHPAAEVTQIVPEPATEAGNAAGATVETKVALVDVAAAPATSGEPDQAVSAPEPAPAVTEVPSPEPAPAEQVPAPSPPEGFVLTEGRVVLLQIAAGQYRPASVVKTWGQTKANLVVLLDGFNDDSYDLAAAGVYSRENGGLTGWATSRDYGDAVGSWITPQERAA